jgi:hypothetical protein
MNYVYVGAACLVAGIFLRPLFAKLFSRIGAGLGKES